MKKILAISFCLISLSLKSQSADETIGQLINNGDYVELGRKFPGLRDKMQVPFLKVMADALVYSSQNQWTEANKCLEDLITNYQTEIGFDNVINMINLWGLNLILLCEYDAAANILGSFISQKYPMKPILYCIFR